MMKRLVSQLLLFIILLSIIVQTSPTKHDLKINDDIEEYTVVIDPTVFSVEGIAKVNWTSPTTETYGDRILWFYIFENGTEKMISLNMIQSEGSSGVMEFRSTQIPYTGTYYAVYTALRDASVYVKSNIATANNDGYSLIMPKTFQVKSSIMLKWNAADGHSLNDEIQFFFVHENSETLELIVSEYVSSILIEGEIRIPSDYIQNVGVYVAQYVLMSGEIAVQSNFGVSAENLFSLSINPNSFQVESSASVYWNAPESHSIHDEIEWYFLAANDPYPVFISSQYVNSMSSSGLVTFQNSSIAKPGTYEAKYFYALDSTIVAQSNEATAYL